MEASHNVLKAWLQRHSPAVPMLTLNNSRRSQAVTPRTAKNGLDMLEEATQGVAGSSESKGETGDQSQQAEGGAQAPPKEIPPAPEPSNPKPGTSKDPTDAPTEVIPQDPTQPPQDPKQPATQNPNEDTPPGFKRADDSLLYIVYIRSVLFQKISHIFQLIQ